MRLRDLGPQTNIGLAVLVYCLVMAGVLLSAIVR
jgi:hypothetical protein